MNRSFLTAMNASLIRGIGLALALFVPTLVLAQATPRLVQVEQGTHQLLRANADVSRVAVGSPEIADVTVVDRRDLLVQGKQLGTTSLMIWVKGTKQPREYRVRVNPVKDPLSRKQPDPELGQAHIEAGRGVEGKLPNLLAHRRARLAAQVAKDGQVADASSVDGDTQVLTEVKIAEVSRRTLQRYGLNIMVNGRGTSGGIFAPGSLGESTQGNINEGVISGALQDAFGLVVTDASKNILGVLNLLEGRGLARTLAEPSLLTTSGQTATYLAGGEFPVPVSQGGATAGGISIEYKEFGVRLSLSPTVLSRDRIALKVAPEVSDLDFSAGIQIGGVAVPALTVRRTDTMVELGDGESFVISGLVSSSLANNVNKVPWLADIPVLGAFFKSTNLDRTERELIMVVTPRLVKPIRRGADLPPLPGARYDGRTPSPAHQIFLETGRFDSGFSR